MATNCHVRVFEDSRALRVPDADALQCISDSLPGLSDMSGREDENGADA